MHYGHLARSFGREFRWGRPVTSLRYRRRLVVEAGTPMNLGLVHLVVGLKEGAPNNP